MNRFVQVPAKGQPMTAQWGADVANGLNAIRSAGQVGMLLADGPTGTGFSPLPANRRDRKASQVLPWTWMREAYDPDTGKARGRWTNASLQVGLHTVPESSISGLEQGEDGSYYVEIDVGAETAEVKRVPDGESPPDHDLDAGKVVFWIGDVRDGRQVGRLFQIPIVYLYL